MLDNNSSETFVKNKLASDYNFPYKSLSDYSYFL